MKAGTIITRGVADSYGAVLSPEKLLVRGERVYFILFAPSFN